MYNIAIALYALAVKLISPFHRKAQLMLNGQKQTFDILRQQIEPEARYIWFHAASLGEFEQGRPMIEKIKQEYPDYKILLTFFSPSGYEVRKNYPGADVICYLPFDRPKEVNRFLDRANPSIAIFIKYEFWMNYLLQLKKRCIPTYIISAIFRPNQLFFRSYANGYKEVLNTFDYFFVQDETSGKLLKEHGKNNFSVYGDTRFDRVMDIYGQTKPLPLLDSFTADIRQKGGIVLVAGSSWPKDEDVFIPYFEQHPQMKLVIAPHEIHASHLSEIISKLNRPVLLYSQANEENIKDADCLIIDCFGLLSSIYRYGDLAYIGGGFGAGIHNILEAAVYGIPVIFGPNYQKFREARELLRYGGGFSINDNSSFNRQMDQLLASKEELQLSGKKAGEYVSRNIGATAKIMKDIFPNN
jgi:3-deoxy-D-manno-octulosonic-acid transferase